MLWDYFPSYIPTKRLAQKCLWRSSSHQFLKIYNFSKIYEVSKICEVSKMKFQNDIIISSWFWSVKTQKSDATQLISKDQASLILKDHKSWSTLSPPLEIFDLEKSWVLVNITPCRLLSFLICICSSLLMLKQCILSCPLISSHTGILQTLQ